MTHERVEFLKPAIPEEITDLRMWALAWADDINRRTDAATYEEDDDGDPL